MKIPIALSSLALASCASIMTELKRSGAIDQDDFVYVDGLRLKDSEGLHYITGFNYWACMNLAADASQGGNYSRLVTELNQLASHGVNHLRIMASSEGAPTTQPFRMNPPLMPSPGTYNEIIFQGLDVCLDEMSKRGMRATMTLNNEWQWSGGFAQYVSWANNDAKIPYPSSWSMTKKPQRLTPGTGWGDYTTIFDGAALFGIPQFTGFANRMYTDAKAEEWYKAHIRTVMTRTNSVNGRKYNEDPTIMTWQLANEPQSLGIYIASDPLFAWVDRISQYIRTMAPKQLINVGLESKQGESIFKAVHKAAAVDYATSHLWVQNWGVYDMNNPSKTNLDNAKNYAANFVKDTSKWARDIGKPILLEEFGMARDNWENKNKEYPYLSSANTTNKDAYFQALIGSVVDDFKANGAYIGTCPWAYGGIWRPETQKMNEFEMVWAGDPPHESPGWYSVYDKDEALNIVSRQQKNVSAWI